MAVKDIRSHAKSTLALIATVASDTTTNGFIIDTANFEIGLMFSVMAPSHTDGTYNFTIEHGEDSALSDAVALTSDFLIGTLAGLELTAATVAGGKLNTIGVFGNKRYVRINSVSTAVTTGAQIEVIATEIAENQPVDPA